MCSNGDQSTGEERLVPLVPGEWEKVIQDAGVRMLQTGAYIWSVNCSQVPLHVRHEGISTRWNTCVGYCYGVRNRPAMTHLNTRYGACGDDVVRSIRFMFQDGIVLHYRTLRGDTHFREGSGGINAEVTINR